MSSSQQKVFLGEHSDKNRIKMRKKVDPNINIRNQNLNIKRKRGNNFEMEEKDDSNETHTETKDTIFGTRINKKVLATFESPKMENYLKSNNDATTKIQNNKKRANRFIGMKRESFIELKKGNKKRTETSSKNEEIKLGSSISDDERIIEIPKKSFKKNKNKQRTNINKIKNSKRKRFQRNYTINNYKSRIVNNNDNSLEKRFINLETNLNEKINNVFEILQSQSNTIRNQKIKLSNQGNTIRKLNIKLSNQSNRIRNQRKKLCNQSNRIRKLNKKIINQNTTIKNQSNEIKNLNTKINKQDNTITEQNMKIPLLTEIYNQSKKIFE